MYELRNVTKTYRKGDATVRALQEVDLSIGDGEFLAIQGPTGQGKTTLLQLLGALDRPTSGSIEFDGHNLATMREGQLTELRSRSFGFIFQSFNLIPTLTAQENVETALVPLGVRPSMRRGRARAALADVGLAERAGHLPSELSGGEQQRVAIARALVRDPRVILADEPSGNLDEQTRDEIIGLLERLWADRGQTLVVVTHDSSIAGRAPARAWIREGRLSIGDVPQPAPVGSLTEPAGPTPSVLSDEGSTAS
jgi:putative ABC transport system ATP-binding protein